MKLNKNKLRRMIMASLNELTVIRSGNPAAGASEGDPLPYDTIIDDEVGSFYQSKSGRKFGELLGSQGLIDELEEAASNIRRIKDVAVKCQSLTLMDDMGGHHGYVDDQYSFDKFQNMIDLCDQILPLLDYQRFLE